MSLHVGYVNKMSHLAGFMDYPETNDDPMANSGVSELNTLVQRHDLLISKILQEEEELISAHRAHIDSMVELIKEEMVHLNHVDRPGSDVDAYVMGLDNILHLKMQYIQDIRQKVVRFQEHLREEDELSKTFQERKQGAPPNGST